MSYEEKLLASKEECHKYRVHIQGLEERMVILKEQLQSYRDRIIELEKENIERSKENYILNSELDYESIKNDQIQKRTEKIHYDLKTKNLVDRGELERVVREYEAQIQRLEERLMSAEENPFDKLAREKLENEIDQLRSENAMLTKQKLLNMGTGSEGQEPSKKLAHRQQLPAERDPPKHEAAAGNNAEHGSHIQLSR